MSDTEENQVLSRALIRLAALDDSALPDALHRLLPKVLPLLRRPSLRASALQLIELIAKRISTFSSHPIPLPLAELVACFLDHQSIPELDAHFSMLFIEKAAFEMTDAQKEPKLWMEVAAPLLSGLSKKTANQQLSILHVMLNLLPAFVQIWRSTSMAGLETIDILAKYGLSLDRMDCKVILAFLLDILLLPYVKLDMAELKDNDIPAGHSLNSFINATKSGKKSWTLLTRSQEKLHVVTFLRSGIFRVEDIFTHILVASVDSSEAVLSGAEDAFKRLGKPSLDSNHQIVQDLFELYLGSISSNIEKSDIRKPASEPIKQKILRELQKSVFATQQSTFAFKILFDSILSPSSSLKLKIYGVQFFQWVLLHGNKSDILKISPVFLSKLLTTLKELAASDGHIELRSLLYEPLASLCTFIPEIVSKSIQIPLFFFKRLDAEELNVKSNVAQALKLLSTAFRKLEPAVESQLRNMLISIVFNDGDASIEPSSIRAKIIAIKWLNENFPFADSELRFLCCNFAASENNELREEASKGLMPKITQLENGQMVLQPFPTFADFVDRIWIDAKLNDESFTPLSPSCHKECLLFAKKCLSFGLTRGLDISIIREKFIHYIQLLLICFEPTKFERQSLADMQIQTSELLIDACKVDLNTISDQVKLEWIVNFLRNSNVNIRVNFAKILGHFSKILPDHQFSELAHNLSASLVDEKIVNSLDKSQIHGTIVSMGFIVEVNFVRMSESSLEQVTFSVVHLLGNSNQMVASSACSCLATIVSSAGLHFSQQESDSKQSDIIRYTPMEALARLFRLAKGSKENNCSLAALDAIGSICCSFENSLKFQATEELVDLISSWLLSMIQTRDEETSVVCGETIAKVCSIPHRNLSDSKFSKGIFSFVVDKLLHEFKNASKLARCNISLWLMCMTFEHGKRIELDGYSSRIQEVLCSLLADSKAVTQEAAAKALSYLYETSSYDVRLELSKSFLFLPGKLSAMASSSNITSTEAKDDSKDKDKDGEGLRTAIYGELVAIAQDLGQPGLLYPMLDLACSHSLWATARGSRYAGKSVERISIQLGPKLESLFPKLIRYQYHPIQFVKQTMKAIWKLIVKDPESLIKSKFTELLVDLSESIGSRANRIRETAALALADILKQIPLEKFSSFFIQLWRSAFHLLDDIDPACRQSAAVFSQTLIKHAETLVQCDARSIPDVVEIFNELLNLLLERGISHSAKEVQALCMACVIVITKKPTDLLAPHLPRLIGMLLEGVAHAELPELSYAMNHTEALNTTKEQLETMKITLVNNSPLALALDNCIEMVKLEQLALTASKIADAVTYGVNLGTIHKASTSIKSLVTKYPTEMSAYCKSLIQSFQTFMFSDSPTLRSVVASSIGSLCAVADSKQVTKVFDLLFGNYLDKNVKNSEEITGLVSLEIVRASRYKSEELRSQLLPFSFVASSDPRSNSVSNWQSVWNEISSGQKDIEENASSIINVSFRFLEEGSYQQREVAAVAIGRVFRSISKLDMIAPFALSTIRHLLSSLGRKDREGKQNIYSAILEVSKRCSTVVEKDDELVQQLVEILLRECSVLANQVDAMFNLSAICAVFENVRERVFLSLQKILEPIFKFNGMNSSGKDSKDEEEEELADTSTGTSSAKRIIRIYESLENMWPDCSTEPRSEIQRHFLFWIVPICISGISGTHSSVRIQALRTLGVVLSRIPSNCTFLPSELLDSTCKTLYQSVEDGKHGAIRAGALHVLYVLLINQQLLMEKHRESITQIVKSLESDDNPAVSMVIRKFKSPKT